jgi:hypothetical protein
VEKCGKGAGESEDQVRHYGFFDSVAGWHLFFRRPSGFRRFRDVRSERALCRTGWLRVI